jgi:N-acyl amino acid synthase FeeM
MSDCGAGPVDVGVARDVEELEESFRLVHDQYVARGYMTSHPTGWRLSVFNALPTTKIFVANAAVKTIGTVALIEDSRLGLPMDQIYRDELRVLRRGGRRLGEVSALAIDPQRESGVAILMRLVRMLVVYATSIAQLDELCIAVNPRHAHFYTLLAFCPFGALKSFGKVNGAPAVALRLDLEYIRSVIRWVPEAGPAAGWFSNFFFGPENYQHVMIQLRRQLPGSEFTARKFAHFFGQHDALNHATIDEVSFIRSLYADPPLMSRSGLRWPAPLPAMAIS